MNIMRQPNGHDCGLLSIAAITDIALGFNLAKCVWDLNKMRRHLITCFERERKKWRGSHIIRKENSIWKCGNLFPSRGDILLLQNALW